MSSTSPKQLDTSQSTSSSIQANQDIRAFIQQLRKLPDDFLLLPRRPSERGSSQSESSSALTSARTGAIMGSSSSHSGQVSMLDMTIVEAVLLKNYGFLRMDCYCKIRIGHSVCETQTCPNGAKNPRWDGVFHFHLQPGIDSFHLEIYDEKQFSTDEKIAWLHAPIPKQVFEGVIVERWYPLSGRLGEGKEGSILLVMSHKKVSHKQATNQLRGMQTQMMFIPNVNRGAIVTNALNPQVPVYVQAGAQSASPVSGANNVENHHPSPDFVGIVQQPIRDEDIDQLAEMFPNVDKAVIKAILENSNGDKNVAISALLALNSNQT